MEYPSGVLDCARMVVWQGKIIAHIQYLRRGARVFDDLGAHGFIDTGRLFT